MLTNPQSIPFFWSAICKLTIQNVLYSKKENHSFREESPNVPVWTWEVSKENKKEQPCWTSRLVTFDCRWNLVTKEKDNACKKNCNKSDINQNIFKKIPYNGKRARETDMEPIESAGKHKARRRHRPWKARENVAGGKSGKKARTCTK